MIKNRPSVEVLYNSRKNDILKDFYIKNLTYYKYYDRVSAYFDSNILKLYSRGIHNIVNNNGRIRFIFSHDITEKDFNLILRGYEDRFNDIIYNQISDLEDSEEISNLAYLISIGVVDIKIALTNSGIFHDKFGLIYDEKDTILFRGSANETVAAINKNYDSFETSVSWKQSDLEIINIRKNDFNSLWNNVEPGVKVLDPPSILFSKLEEFNKGKLIISNSEDSIILDYENMFFATNNLYEKEKLDINQYDFMNIKRYISHIDDNIFYFKDKNNYTTIEKIINHFIDYSNFIKVNIFITQRLKDYINAKKFEIDLYKSVGIAIKENKIEEHSVLDNEFKLFKKIISRDMLRVLREPQIAGSFHLSMLKKASNFSVPGSGKTSIVYGTYAYLNSKEINKVDRIVMIGPLNSFDTWKREFEFNFGNKKELRYFDISEYEDKEYNLKFNMKDKNLVLINYELLQFIDKYDLIDSLMDSRTLLVFDEIHRIKNPDGKRASVALEIAKKCVYKIALTGTPIPNGYQDIYNILNILYPDEYQHFFRFSHNHLINANKSTRYSDKINDDIYPFFMRTTKKDLKIPIPNDDDIESGYIEMNDTEKRLFEIIYKTYNNNTFLLYMRLMQATINPKAILNDFEDFNNLMEMYNFDNNNKNIILNSDNYKIRETDRRFILELGYGRKLYKTIDLIKKLVSEGKQVLVWCVFVDTIKLIKQELDSINIKGQYIYGGTEVNERKKIIEDFKSKKINVLISNPHTIAESISLHKECHDAIYVEYTFNLTHMLQSRDRINRLGLKDDDYTQYYYMILDSPGYLFNSIDRKIYERLKEKEITMINAIENNGTLYYHEDDIQKDIENLFKK